MQMYQDFHLDGIDIDWEYPGQPGETGNQVNADDSNNFLLFLRQLRSSLPPSAKISAAATQQPFVDTTGQVMRNVADFANVLDWVLIMNYDTWECEQDFLKRIQR
jgi:chitinase